MTHGKASTYRGAGCRCEPCTAAHRELRREERARHNPRSMHCCCPDCVAQRRLARKAETAASRAKRKEEAKLARQAARAARHAAVLNNPNDPRHGSANTYNLYRCRCRPCTTAKLMYDRSYRIRRTATTSEDDNP